jgi:hypothetical protein
MFIVVRRIQEDEVSELLSLGVNIAKTTRMNKDELQDLVDDTKQMMIREFRAAYSLTEKNIESKSALSICQK